MPDQSINRWFNQKVSRLEHTLTWVLVCILYGVVLAVVTYEPEPVLAAPQQPPQPMAAPQVEP